MDIVNHRGTSSFDMFEGLDSNEDLLLEQYYQTTDSVTVQKNDPLLIVENADFDIFEEVEESTSSNVQQEIKVHQALEDISVKINHQLQYPNYDEIITNSTLQVLSSRNESSWSKLLEFFRRPVNSFKADEITK
ncbi:MAG: hypothetical protein WCG10_04905, partial [Chlamydiota bacterium]